MNFGEALRLLKAGRSVAREGWNGKGIFLFIVRAKDLQEGLKFGYGEYEGEPIINDSVAIKTAQNTIVIGWQPSQTDMLAEDWRMVK